ncbi:hypothetical protein phiST2_0159 [Vibrio phage phi-ST2]|nr:hypothetical protein phiST2_0159 [Vibrio phage phi-ST2]
MPLLALFDSVKLAYRFIEFKKMSDSASINVISARNPSNFDPLILLSYNVFVTQRT